MIKLLTKTIAIAAVSVLTACAGPGITVQLGGSQQRQAQPQAYAQPINYGGAQQQGYQQQPQQGQQQQQQNGGCGPYARRIGTNPQGGAHCEGRPPQQAQQPTQERRYYPQQQGQPQQKNCNGAGYRDLTTGRFIPAC